MPLGEHLGRRTPDHLSRWFSALMAGQAAAPRCGGVTREGRSCRGMRIHGSNFCILHTRGGELDRINGLRRQRLLRQLAGTGSAGLRERIERQLRNIERRALHRAWVNDPTVEGSTIELDPSVEERVRVCLREAFGLDLDAIDRVTGRGLTPRALDRARWAGCFLLKGRLDHEAARRRVAGLLRDERRYWDKARGAP